MLVGVDEGRKPVPWIAASILAAHKLAQYELGSGAGLRLYRPPTSTRRFIGWKLMPSAPII